MALGTRASRFALGQVVSTPGARAALVEVGEGWFSLVARHQAADFGELDAEDVALQNAALEAEKSDPEMAERMMSAYTLKSGVKVWVITEADRSVTTILLPSEY